MKRTPAALLALALLTAPACGFVEDVVRDPLGTILAPIGEIPFIDEAIAYTFDGVLNVLFLGVVVLSDTELEDHPGWVCHFACNPEDPDPEARVGYVSCSNCETQDGIYIATNDVAVVVTPGDWYVDEFASDGTGAFIASFDMEADTQWTWTDGEQELLQAIYVRDAVNIAAFDLGADDGGAELDRIELSVGESIDLELLPVDAEGHVLAGNYLDVSFASAIAVSERVSFAVIEDWEDGGTIARITGSAAGESTFVVRCSGVERTYEIVVR